MKFPPVPREIKSVNHFLKIAQDHEERNIVVSYWSCMFAVQHAMKMVPGAKPPAVSKVLMAIMDWLEETKKNHHDVEGIVNDVEAQALIEDYCLKLFNYADGQEKAQVYDKNMVKAFYTTAILMDVLTQFSALSEDFEEKRKFARWRAAYIHDCLRQGEIPVLPGTIILPDEEKLDIRQRLYLPDEPKEDEPTTSISLDSPGAHVLTQPEFPPVQYPKPDPNYSAADDPLTKALSGLNPHTNFGQPRPPRPAGNDSNESNSSHPDLLLPDVPQLPNQPTFPQFPSVPQYPAASNVAQTPTSPQPVAPQPTPSSSIPSPSGQVIGPEEIEKAQKFCKWASSALNYDDVATAIDNLQKALHLLQSGRE